MTTSQAESILVNPNILLKTANNSYAKDLYNVIDFNRNYFSQFMAWPKFVINELDTAQFLQECELKHQQNQSKTYVIIQNDRAVGILSFNQIDANNKTAYIGYWLDSRAEGKGVMTQAVQALTNYYASQKIIKRFVIKCAVSNIKSNAVAKRCGFSYEGRLKQAEYLNGVYHDQNIYGLISTYM